MCEAACTPPPRPPASWKQRDMGSPAELSLDYKPNCYLATQKQLQGLEQPDQKQKIQEFLARLEEERFKIEAFKRELPLCLQLLNNAVESYRQQLEACRTNPGPQPVLEEFIPLKNVDGSDKATNAPSEKATWMISAQLWSPANDADKQSPGTRPAKDAADHGFDIVNSPKLALDAKQRNGGGFLPFSKEKNKIVSGKTLPEVVSSSPPPHKEVGEKKCMDIEINGVSAERKENDTVKGSREAEEGGNGGNGSQSAQGQVQVLQPHRKARRCWSPDLHRRFVNALQILGGSQVATPKQIRELMKVDGLTNDEVKSHLQKYRLHTRRPIPPHPAPAAAAAPQLVVLGGIWVPPEYAASAAGPAAIYGAAHPAPAHCCAAATTTMPQEYYPPPLQVHHLHHHNVHPPALHRSASVPSGYNGRVSSPESEGRSGAEQSESIEEDERQEREEREDEEETEAEEDDEEDKGTNKAKAPAAERKASVPLAVKADGCGLKF